MDYREINAQAINMLLDGKTLKTISNKELADLHGKLVEEKDTGFIIAVEMEIMARLKND